MTASVAKALRGYQPMTTRRRIASLVLLVGVVYVGLRFFGSSDKLVQATLVYQVPPGAQRLEAEVRPRGGGDPVARFLSVVDPGVSELRQKTRLPPGSHEVVIDVAGDGFELHTTRAVEVTEDAVVTIRLERAAAAPPR